MNLQPIWKCTFRSDCRERAENVGNTIKLGNKEHFDKEQIGVKEPFPVTKCQFTS